MISRNLIIKFYLWFLLALTLTVTSAGVAFVLVDDDHFAPRSSEWMEGKVRLGRDLVQIMVGQNQDLMTLNETLIPLLNELKVSASIFDPGGGRRWEHRVKGARAEDFSLSWPAVQSALSSAGVYHSHNHGTTWIALPFNLPDGQPAIFMATAHYYLFRSSWLVKEITSLGAVLVVGWLLCWPLAIHLTRPLRRLADTADALGSGDLSARIELSRKDEIGRLAERFNSMGANIQRLVEGHKRLLADISHELRTPLARQKVALELAREDAPETVAQYLDVMEKQSDQLEEMIGELLIHSRLDGVPYRLNLVAVDSANLVRSEMLALQNEITGKQLRVDFRPAADVESVQADDRLLRRALSNVLRNAVNYTPPGGQIEIDLTAAGGQLTIKVADNGPGVEAGHLEDIFEPFFRTDSARTRHTGGVGMGLAITRRCMMAHGGEAWAEKPESGQGLRIVMQMPLSQPEQA